MKLLSILLFITLSWTYCLLHELSKITNNNIIQVGAPNSCQHEFINQTFGILTTPYYPLGYPDETYCKWVIQMAEGLRIVLSTRKFILGPGDSLEVFQKKEDESILYDLDNPPNDVIYSKGNSLTLILKAQRKKKTENAIRNGLDRNRTFYAIFEREGCGGVLTDPNGYIIVPSYIHLSQRSHECVWTIFSPKNKVVVLNFLQFDLSPGTCIYSKLHIRDGDRNAGYIIGDFCEENPPLHDLRTATNVMYISYRTRPNFLSKHTETIPSIKMYYHIADACGGDLTSFSGSFSSPKRWLDGVYACNWTINVPHGKQLSIKIYNWKKLNSTDTEYDELSFITPDKPPHIWSSKEDIKPLQAMVIPSNQLIVTFLSHRTLSSKAKLEFYCVYEALQTPLQKCIDVGIKRFFMCDEWSYIDCNLRCNGVYDCENGKDEEHCPSLRYDNEFDIRHDHLKKSVNISIYFTFLFVAICVSLVIVVASLTFNRFYKRSQNMNTVSVPNTSISQYPYYPNIYPPPYGTRDICTVSRFCRAPPPYPYSFDETNLTDESSLRLSLVAVSVANQTSHDQSHSTTSTDRLREFDLQMNRYDYTRSLDTVFLLDEGVLDSSDAPTANLSSNISQNSISHVTNIQPRQAR